jgi:septal ring factor EnvC (AmiA/AmiB activator)
VPDKQEQQKERRNFAPKISKSSRKLNSLKHKMSLTVNAVQTLKGNSGSSSDTAAAADAAADDDDDDCLFCTCAHSQGQHEEQ